MSRKLRILVANDNPFQLEAISSNFKLLDQVEFVDKAYNGQEALDLVMDSEKDFSNGGPRVYDIIFMDLTMPVMGGCESC